MLEKIFGYFGYTVVTRSLIEEYSSRDGMMGFYHLKADEAEKKVKEQAELILKLKAENISLKAIERKDHPLISVSFGDPEPQKRSERIPYTAAVAGFHDKYMREKYFALIGLTRTRLERVDTRPDDLNDILPGYTSHEVDIYLKGMIGAYWNLYDWGEKMIGEYQAYLSNISDEERDSLFELVKKGNN